MVRMTERSKRSGAPAIRLAIFGAPPAFETPVLLHRPHRGHRAPVLARFAEMLDHSAPAGGSIVAEFEARIADALEVPHCVAASNTGAALELAVRGLALTGEVILPAFMPATAAHTLQRQGVTPVFCDIDASTRTLDPRKVASLVTPRTSGIIAAHLWGQPCQVEALAEVARAHDVRLLFDARHAFGAMHRGRMLGGFGDAEVFGFDTASVLYACDGGAVTTANAALARRLRIIQNLGFDDSGASVCLGIEGTMNAACAAMGLAGLEALHANMAINRRYHARYDLQLADLAGIVLCGEESMEQRPYQHVVVEVDPDASGLTRDALLAVLHAENIGATRDYYPGSHRIEPYRLPNAEAWLRLQATERLAERALCLPAGGAVDEAVIDRICACIRRAVAHAGAIMARLRPPERAGLKR